MIAEHWIDVTNLPAHGREFFFEDDTFWQAVWAEFNADYVISGPFAAKVTICPQPEGILLRGVLQGTILATCHRCAEAAKLDILQDFDTFEAYEDVDTLEGEEVYLRSTDRGWTLNIGALLREELLLALPEKILCASNCLGLCPLCGKNRNEESCQCSSSDSQPPLARALRGITIKNN